VFTSVFSDPGFPAKCLSSKFVDYSIGNWECKCSNLKGLHHRLRDLSQLRRERRHQSFQTGDVIANKVAARSTRTATPHRAAIRTTLKYARRRSGSRHA